MNKGLYGFGPTNGPKCICRHTSVISLTTATLTDIPLDTIEFDSGHMSLVAKLTNSLIIPRDGWYSLVGEVAFVANGTGVRVSDIYVTHPDGEVSFADGSGPGSAGANTGVPVVLTMLLRRGANVKLKAFQNSGAGLNTVSGFISATWVGPG